jgi:PRC-barrel domain
VLDSSGRYFGEVAHLYIDEDERKLRFVDVLTLGFFALGRKHYLVPVETIADESASRSQIKLNVDEETLKRSPTAFTIMIEPASGSRSVRRSHGRPRW